MMLEGKPVVRRCVTVLSAVSWWRSLLCKKQHGSWFG